MNVEMENVEKGHAKVNVLREILDDKTMNQKQKDLTDLSTIFNNDLAEANSDKNQWRASELNWNTHA